MFVRIGAVILLQSAVVMAGPLTPPPGPIAATMKTLSDVEPRTAINAVNTPGDANSLYKISQPGSYYLTGNITGVAGKHGVEIEASGVTLDLNGFDLVGAANAGGPFDGVHASLNGLANIAVVNGSVRDWQGSGVLIESTNCRVDGVCAKGNGVHGIYAGTNGAILNCSASENAFAGIRVFQGGRVTNCAATANGNGSNFGFLVGFGAVVTGCTAIGNAGGGISADGASTISNCSVYSNGGVGIQTGAGCTLSGCTVRSNSANGIRVSSDCQIRDNSCSSNGFASSDGANIHATGSDNRIEGNNCTGADRGIDVDGSGNFIVRNTCSGNTINWAISANNVFGPIVDRRSPNTTAFFGDSAASSLGTSDANANFTY